MAKIGLWNYVKFRGLLSSVVGQVGKGLNSVLANISVKFFAKILRMFT